MLRDITKAYFSAGLQLNANRCKVQTNTKVPRGVSTLQVDDLELPKVTSADGFMVLGTLLSLSGRVSKQLKRRIGCAWENFHQLWPLLGRRHTCLHRRVGLFDSTVSKTMLWCCESWALTMDEKRMLLTTQRVMLRRIAATRCRPDQDYVMWVQDATHQAEARARNAGVRSWLDACSQQKWHWVGHVMRMAASRLAQRTSLLRDAEWWSVERHIPHRPHHAQGGAQHVRWEDDLRK